MPTLIFDQSPRHEEERFSMVAAFNKMLRGMLNSFKSVLRMTKDETA